jgi:hypothetical protein
MKQCKVTIETDGSVHIETIGYRGKACLADTSDLEKAYGITEVTPTREMHLPEKAVTRVGQ